MIATLRALVAEPRYHLRPVTALGADVLDRPVVWAHSSDLLDPTPWLEAGQLLLTNGAQLDPATDPAEVRRYVDRLASSEIGALGFATQVVHETVPEPLVDACSEAGLPLLEVSERTPFISIIRHVADGIAAEQRERLESTLAAQRALARAALRPDGLAEVLRELQRRLDCWVALYDAAGARVAVRGSLPVPQPLAADVSASVRTVLAKGLRAGMQLTAVDGAVTLQTLGQRDQLRGVLAVGTAAPLDAAGTDLVASVIGLASIAVEQSRALESARQELRTGLLELLLAGAVDMATSAAERLGDRVPDEPLRVAVVAEGPQMALLREELATGRQRWFTAPRGEHLVVVLPSRDDDRFTTAITRHPLPAGLSGPGPWTEAADLLHEALCALGNASPGSVARFESRLGDGMLGLVGDRGGAEVARRVLAPLTEHPDRDVHLETMRTWLRHGCAWDPAARELGIHRHTLRNRASTVERLLGLDLSTFVGRAELWLALELDPHRPPGVSRSGGSPG